jgi:hypothetical protein
MFEATPASTESVQAQRNESFNHVPAWRRVGESASQLFSAAILL